LKLAIISATAAALASVGMVTVPVASADPEERFLTNLEIGGFSWPDEAAGQISSALDTKCARSWMVARRQPT
jgi:hypothetical protein